MKACLHSTLPLKQPRRVARRASLETTIAFFILELKVLKDLGSVDILSEWVILRSRLSGAEGSLECLHHGEGWRAFRRENGVENG